MANLKAEAATTLHLATDVLVLGGGPAGAWAALTAAQAGSKVVLADKGFFGTSGATAPSNTGTWCVPPGPQRRAAIDKRAPKTAGLADPECAERVLAETYDGLLELAERGYAFPRDPLDGSLYIANLRGPDYMRFMRKLVKAAGVKVLDHHPALELIQDVDGVVGAAGLGRQSGRPWRISAGAVVLATGGCAFGERMLGATGLTGDGYLMGAEAGARLSGMEFSAQYGIAPAHTSLNKGLLYRWATFYDADRRPIDLANEERQAGVARSLLQGTVYARFDRADRQIQDWLRRGQANCFLPFDRQGINPFTELFEVTMRCEGTVRGLGGIRLASAGGATDVTGLFAAGDVASRESLNGAISGGGGPNASWAIASGRAAGRSAHLFTTLYRRHLKLRAEIRAETAYARSGEREPPRGLGTTSLGGPGADAVVAGVRGEMLPLDRHFFRNGDSLQRSSNELEALWTATRSGFSGQDNLLRRREASAMLATARWSVAAAHLRRESRGIHRRTDATAADPALAHRIEIRGVEQLQLSLAGAGAAAGLARAA